MIKINKIRKYVFLQGCREDTFMRNVEIEMAYFILKQKQKQCWECRYGNVSTSAHCRVIFCLFLAHLAFGSRCLGDIFNLRLFVRTSHSISFCGCPVSKKFRSRRWGSSLPGLRTRDPPLGPPSTWAEIFRHACLQSGLQKSQKGKNSLIGFFWGVGGAPKFFFQWNPHIFVS